MRKQRVYFTVSFEKPPRATLKEVKAYLYDAVGTMKGCYRPPGGYGDNDPGDPMWDLDYKTIRVSLQVRK